MKKLLERILIITLLLISGLTIGYFIFGWNTINGSQLSSESFIDGFYVSLDKNYWLSFGSMKQIIFIENGNNHYINNFEYKYSIFKFDLLDDNKSFYMSVIDEETIYCYDFDTYVYKVVTDNGK